VRILIAGESPADTQRVDALVRGCGFESLHTQSEPFARAVALICGSPSWDALIVACPTRAAEMEALLATLDFGARGFPIVLLTDEISEEVATLAHRFGARTCVFTHGPNPLRHAVLRLMASWTKESVRALVYTSVADVIFYLRVEGRRFRFMEINPAFTKATGLTEAQVVGRYVEEVIPEPSLSMVLARYREAIAEGRTVRWDEVTEYPTGRKHGEVSVTPIVDAGGRCLSLVGTVKDVTEARRSRALSIAEQRVLELVASGTPLPTTLTVLVRAIEEQVPPALASILLLSSDGTRVLRGAAPSLPEEYTSAIDGAPIGPKGGSCGTAAALGRPVIVTDIEADPLWDDYRELARRFGLRACWSTPILTRDGRVLGTYALYYREPRSPMTADFELIARVTHVAGIAIQRHELDEQLRELSARIEAAREDERTEMAREIHDQLGQFLTVLKMDLAWISRRATSEDGISTEALLGRLKELSEMTDRVIDEVRRLSERLRPSILDDIGLESALVWQAEEFERRTRIACTVGSELPEERLGREVSTAVFRVFQEALTNVARHANASHVDAHLEERDGSLLLCVRDDGKGIRPEEVQDPRAYGLLGMRERARRLGGTISFAPADPRGTVVTLCVPLGSGH
jgi:PAS domain S-box-containing protein